MPTQRSLHVEWCFWETKVLLARCHAAEGLGKITPKNSYKNYKRDKKNWAKTKTRAKRAMLKTHIKKIEKKIYCTSWPRKKIRAQKIAHPLEDIHDPWSMRIHAQWGVSIIFLTKGVYYQHLIASAYVAYALVKTSQNRASMMRTRRGVTEV